MLISQPLVMWKQWGVSSLVKAICIWFLLFFPKAFFSCVMTWAEYAAVTELYSKMGYLGRFFTQALVVLSLYILAIYTYFKVIYVGPGSPLDYEELTRDRRLSTAPLNPYGTAEDGHNMYTSTKDSTRDPMLRDPDTIDGAGNVENSANARYSGGTEGLRYPPSEFLVSHSFRNNEPAFRWCGTCQVWKPDRCHHCLTCQRCFLKMDHHCPWFASCIGFKNHKFFIQVLLYITAFSGATCYTAAALIYNFFVEEQYAKNTFLSLNLVFLFVVSLAFFFAVGCFTGFSVYLVFRNYTTIEFQDEKWSYLGDLSAQYEYDADGNRKKLGHLYNLGPGKNWRSVMGESWFHWLFPVTVTDTRSAYSGNNGLNFEVDEDVFQKYIYNAQLQEQLNAQLAEYRDRIRGKHTTQDQEVTSF